MDFNINKLQDELREIAERMAECRSKITRYSILIQQYEQEALTLEQRMHQKREHLSGVLDHDA